MINELTAEHAKSSLAIIANQKRSQLMQRFFKTAPGEYGYGDQFIGVSIPDLRKISRTFQMISLEELQLLINSKIHEERLLALIILVNKYKKYPHQHQLCYDFYMKNLHCINNWDLVDISAPYVVGDYLFHNENKILFEMAHSENLWIRRIAIIATLNFIRHNKFDTTCQIAEILINDKHDLIHKASGWMLREMGKRNLPLLEKFLKKWSSVMPRTALRYAIEKFPENKRQFYLQRKK